MGEEVDTAKNADKYKFVTDQVQYFNEKMIESFTMWVKMLLAIFGGVAWVLSREGVQTFINEVAIMAAVLVGVVGISSLALIRSNWECRRGFHLAEHRLNPDTAEPSKSTSTRSEVLLSSIVLITTLMAIAIFLWIRSLWLR